MRGRRPDLGAAKVGGMFEAPEGLGPEAGALFERIAPLTPRLTEANVALLADFCWCLAELEAERALLKKEGAVVQSKAGRVKNPRAQRERELRQAVQRYSLDLGLSPSGAWRLSGGKPLGESDHDDAGGVLDGDWEAASPPGAH